MVLMAKKAIGPRQDLPDFGCQRLAEQHDDHAQDHRVAHMA